MSGSTKIWVEDKMYLIDDEVGEYIGELLDKLDAAEKERKVLGWLIATLRDTLAYNEYDKIDLDMILKCLDIAETADPFTKEVFEEIYNIIQGYGLSTLPTTNKAIEALKDTK
jgi:hypothetical protein